MIIRIVTIDTHPKSPKATKKTKRIIVAQCDICGTEFTIKYCANRLKQKNVSCSRTCGAKSREKNMAVETRVRRSSRRSAAATALNQRVWASLDAQHRMRRCKNISIATRKAMALIPVDIRDATNACRSSTMRMRWHLHKSKIIDQWRFTMAIKGVTRVSKPELNLLKILRDKFGVVEQQVHVNGWLIDFYIPPIRTYVQVDGEYWHGKGCTVNELLATGISRDIKRAKTILKDRKQNEWFAANDRCLIRVWATDTLNMNVSVILNLGTFR